MTPWNPLALWFLLLIPPIVLLYLLKMRREPQTISTTMLWERVLSDLQANTPFQKLRSNLQLILQLLLVILLTLALCEFFIRGEARRGRTFVAILDASASMQSRDGSPTRFDEAKQKLLGIINGMGANDEMMILLAAGGGVRSQLSFSGVKGQLTQFVKALSPTDSLSGVREALLLSIASIKSRLRDRQRKAEILLLSDGALQSLADLGQLQYPIRFIGCGRRANNVAITSLNVRRLPHTTRRYAVFVEVTNYSKQSQSFYLSLGEGFEGGEISSRKVRLGPGKSLSKTFKLEIRPGPINLSVDVKDDLALDNRAVAFIQAPKRLKVLLASAGNFYIRKALGSDPMTEVALSGTSLSRSGGYDLVICDGFVPSTLPDCPVLYFAPPKPPAGIKQRDRYQGIRITHWNRSHPYMRYLDLSNVEIFQADTYVVENGRGLAFRDQKAVIVTLNERPYEDVVVGFKLHESNWPLRLSWPLFLFNILERIRELKHLAAARTVGPGQTVPIEPGTAKTIVVTDPDGKPHELPTDGAAVYFHQTERVGTYQIDAEGRKSTFAVNLLSHEESHSAPRSSLDFGGEMVSRKSDVQQVNKPLWRWFALAALLICMIEWWVFHRKIA